LAPTDAFLFKFGALLDLADVYRLAGRSEVARAAVEEARQLAESKGATAMEAAAERLLLAVDAPSVI
ncbi:MAG: hypothetical protein ACRDQT_00055, partial [Gaiellaceae bacterium]